MRSRLKSEDGQASVENVGLMALVAGALVAAITIVGVASPQIREAVRGSFMHALCVVTGEGCDLLAREPCPTLRTVKTTSQGLSVWYGRLGHDKVLAIERRSDGTYELSVIEGFQTGAGAARAGGQGAQSYGAEAKMTLGHRAGRIYRADTPGQARAIAERLKKEHFTEARTVVGGAADLLGLAKTDPSVAAYVLAGDGAAEALGKFGLGGLLEGSGKIGGRSEIGVKIAPGEQEITAYRTWDGRADAFFQALNEVTVPVGRRRTGPTTGTGAPGGAGGGGVDLRKPGAGSASGQGDPTADPRTRVTVKNPLAQKLEGEAVEGGTIALRFGPGPTLKGVEVVGYYGANGRRRELRARLDPSDPAVRDALARWQSDPASPAAIADLGRAARDRAAIDVRTFDTKRTEHPHGGALEAKGLTVGLEFGSASVVSSLTKQRSRLPGGEWEDRTDCVMPAVKG